jgi:hypothetical protein
MFDRDMIRQLFWYGGGRRFENGVFVDNGRNIRYLKTVLANRIGYTDIDRKKEEYNFYFDKADKWYNVIYGCYSVSDDDSENEIEALSNIVTQGRHNGRMDFDDGRKKEKRLKALMTERNVIIKDGKLWSFTENFFDGIHSFENCALRLYRLIDFFMEFTFLSPLGLFLRNHLYSYCNEKQWDGFEQRPLKTTLVRNVDYEEVLSYEAVFVCLKAIHERRLISYNGVSCTPLKVFFKDSVVNGMPRKAYVYVRTADNHLTNLPLFGNAFIKIDGKVRQPERETENATAGETVEPQNRQVRVRFYTYRAPDSNNPDYILDQINLVAHEAEELHPNIQIMIKSAYHGDLTCGPVTRTYKIADDDLPDFKEWVQGFGEFAQIIKETPPSADLPEATGLPEKLEMLNARRNAADARGLALADFLMNPYNSLFLEDKLDNAIKEMPALEKKNIVLPPTNLEIYWLRYVLEKYPNMSKIFLTEDAYNKIKKAADCYYGKHHRANDGDFDPFEGADSITKAVDIEADALRAYRAHCNYVVEKTGRIKADPKTESMSESTYQRVTEAVETERSAKSLLFYALNYDHALSRFTQSMYYDFGRHAIRLIPQRNFPFELAAYELVQDADYHNDKKYLVFGEYIRTKCWKHRRIPDDDNFDFDYNNHAKVHSLIGKVLKKFEVNSKTIFKEGRIPLDLKKIRGDVKEAYEALTAIPGAWRTEFIKKVFSYYYNALCKDSPSAYDIHLETDGAPIFPDDELIYKTCVLQLFHYFNQSTDEAPKDELDLLIKQLTEKDFVSLAEKESAFYATCLKMCSLTLVLCDHAKNDVAAIERLYRVFARFNGIYEYGKKKEKNKLFFVVYYERFDFRKIHRCILSVRDIASVTEPLETKFLIESRLDEMKRIQSV